jgi:hypothetical protein
MRPRAGSGCDWLSRSELSGHLRGHFYESLSRDEEAVELLGSRLLLPERRFSTFPFATAWYRSCLPFHRAVQPRPTVLVGQIPAIPTAFGHSSRDESRITCVFRDSLGWSVQPNRGSVMVRVSSSDASCRSAGGFPGSVGSTPPGPIRKIREAWLGGAPCRVAGSGIQQPGPAKRPGSGRT